MKQEQSPWIGLVMIAGLVLLLANPQGCQPAPTVPTITSGPRTVILVRESSDVTPAMARTEVLLRAGDQAKYLSAKNHRLWILSDDQAPPASLSAASKEAVSQAKAKAPAVAVVDEGQSGGSSRVLAVDSIRPDATPEDVLAIVKKHGG